jgi:predicted trehalose synthase
MTQRVLARADELVARVRVALDPGGIGPKIRHHGDYHLGQTLHTPDGWRILDFEGEPTRPLAERRLKHHPLRDVAGMLRSLAYAAAVAGIPAAEPRMRAAFLAGYDPTLLDDPRRADLLALFTSEKLFYELDYELGHRPDWVRIPLAAIAAMLPADPA